ncbi:MAG: hypothetical protein ACOCVH_02085 [Verrucomicrobiota bacterium]
MPRKPIPETELASIRQEYLAGKGSLRKLAKAHGLSYAALAKYASAGGWADEKRSIDENRPKMGQLVRAADNRAAAIEQSWRKRVEPILNTVGGIIEREADLLNRSNTKGATWQERATLIKLLTDSLEKLHRALPGGETTGNATIDPSLVDKAGERLLKRLGKL